MSLPLVPFAVRPTGESVSISPTFALWTGNTGSGKTTAAQAAVAGYAKVDIGMPREAFQCIILDPKIVSWHNACSRYHVFTKPEDFIQVMIALDQEIERRYFAMSKCSVDTLPITEENPFILLLIEEAPAIIGSSSFLVKAEAEQFKTLLTRYTRMARQANCSVWVISQSGFTECVPTAVKSNLHQRVVLRAGSDEESTAASARPADEVRATTLIPGEAYALTESTQQHFIRCRAFSPDKVRFGEAMRDTAQHKLPLPFLEQRGLTS
jgi:hypothetical protein